VFNDEIVKRILEKTRTIWAVTHALSLLSWDSETYMPPKGVEERSVAVGELTVLRQKLLLDDELVKLVEKSVDKKDLNDYEKGVVRVLNRHIRIAKALPPELVKELSKTSQEARVVWREAKKKDDFNKFKPYLNKIVELTKEKAEYLGYDDHPYDALLDLYEEGLLTREVDRMFGAIEPGIRKVFNRVMEDGDYPSTHPLEGEKYDEEKMKQLNIDVLNIFGYPFDKARLDISAHPFTNNMGIEDVRITTRYEGFDFKRSLLGTIHEFGHALYELQIDPALKFTPLAGGVSLGIHESQSRFWENIIGRSRVFVESFYEKIISRLDYVKKYSPEEVFKYFNTVKPSFIRVEADELTYNLHIILRFKLEKLLVSGEIKAEDTPELWNQEMEKLLGIRPRKYSEGVLQDIHWSLAAIGYFPTYSIGTLLSAQILHHISRDIPAFNENVSRLEFDDIKRYLYEKIHRWGSTYDPKTLLKMSFGEEMNPEYFLKYIKEKYIVS